MDTLAKFRSQILTSENICNKEEFKKSKDK